VSKDFTVGALVHLLAGFAGGLLAGWLTAAWVLQRLRRHPLRHRLWVTIAAAPFLIIAPLSAWASAGLAMVAAWQDPSAKIMKAPLVVIPGLWWPVTIVAAASAVVALGLAALPARVPVRWRAGTVAGAFTRYGAGRVR
jgi:hypothetical protein